MSTSRVVVLGGGLAGISAALTLADAGLEVTLLERRPHLGGLTTSIERDGYSFDNGQHVFLGCCSAYRELLTRLGVTDKVYLQSRLDDARARAPVGSGSFVARTCPRLFTSLRPSRATVCSPFASVSLLRAPLPLSPEGG